MRILTLHLALTYSNHCPTSCRTNNQLEISKGSRPLPVALTVLIHNLGSGWHRTIYSGLCEFRCPWTAMNLLLQPLPILYMCPAIVILMTSLLGMS